MRDAFRAIVLVAMLSAAGFLQAQQHVTSGDEIDYQPAIIESSDGTRIVVFELPHLPRDEQRWRRVR